MADKRIAPEVEKIARELCIADGLDPDEEIIGGQAAGFENYGPRWQCPHWTGIYYLRRAEEKFADKNGDRT